MSKSRQGAARVRSHSVTHPPGQVVLPTQPGWDYLVCAETGVFTAVTESQAWTIPAHRVLCVRDGTRVRIDTTQRTPMRCLYLDSQLHALGDAVRVVNLTPLARELMWHAVDVSPMGLDTPAQAAAITLLSDCLAGEPEARLQLPLPVDSVAARVAQSIMSDPAAELIEHLEVANSSRRTLERRFKLETRLSLGQWQRRARILQAVRMLAEGRSVTRTAVTVGYASPSSFVSAFRSELGTPPREFMQREK